MFRWGWRLGRATISLIQQSEENEYLIFLIFSPQANFFVAFFSHKERRNHDKMYICHPTKMCEFPLKWAKVQCTMYNVQRTIFIKISFFHKKVIFVFKMYFPPHDRFFSTSTACDFCVKHEVCESLVGFQNAIHLGQVQTRVPLLRFYSVFPI